MKQDRAAQLMSEGCVCAEAVLQAACEELGTEVDREIIPKIAFGFAGGIGNTGSVCGAVAGGVMAISLTLKKEEDMKIGLENLAVLGEFRRRFESEMKSINCRDLTGLDLGTEEGITQLMTTDIPKRVCFPAVSLAARLAVDIAREHAAQHR